MKKFVGILFFLHIIWSIESFENHMKLKLLKLGYNSSEHVTAKGTFLNLENGDVVLNNTFISKVDVLKNWVSSNRNFRDNFEN